MFTTREMWLSDRGRFALFVKSVSFANRTMGLVLPSLLLQHEEGHRLAVGAMKSFNIFMAAKRTIIMARTISAIFRYRGMLQIWSIVFCRGAVET